MFMEEELVERVGLKGSSNTKGARRWGWEHILEKCGKQGRVCRERRVQMWIRVKLWRSLSRNMGPVPTREPPSLLGSWKEGHCACQTVTLLASLQNSEGCPIRQRDPGKSSNKTFATLNGPHLASYTTRGVQWSWLSLLHHHPRLIGSRIALFKFKSPWQG